MKYPTDDELAQAGERLPLGDESSVAYRAQRLLNTRRRLRRRARKLPPDIWWEEWRHGGGPDHELRDELLGGGGYGRLLNSSPFPWTDAAAVGLDVMDPDLYSALVAEEVSRLNPPEVTVRSLRYVNPFGEELVAADQAASVFGKVAGVIETAATLGSRRKIAEAESMIAENTVSDRLELSRLDVELKRELLRAQRLANQQAEQELLARKIENAKALRVLSPDQHQHAVVQQLTRAGQLDEADAAAQLDASDVSVLTQFATHRPELKQRYEPDPG